MRVLVFVLIITLFAFNAMAQEQPEPTTIPITYEFQIAWGTKSTLIWIDIIPTNLSIIIGSVALTHVYSGILGDNKFEFEAADSIATNSTKGVVVFNLLTVPSNKLIDIFRIRVRASVTYGTQTITSEWSEPSYWVSIINIRKLNQPISIK